MRIIMRGGFWSQVIGRARVAADSGLAEISAGYARIATGRAWAAEDSKAATSRRTPQARIMRIIMRGGFWSQVVGRA